MPTVTCKQCRVVLDEPPDMAPEQRQPCPQCGSLARRFVVYAKERIIQGRIVKQRIPPVSMEQSDSEPPCCEPDSGFSEAKDTASAAETGVAPERQVKAG